MNPQEEQLIKARCAHYERQCGNLATSGAEMAALAEGLAMQLKDVTAERDKLKAENEELKKPKLEAVK